MPSITVYVSLSSRLNQVRELSRSLTWWWGRHRLITSWSGSHYRSNWPCFHRLPWIFGASQSDYFIEYCRAVTRHRFYVMYMYIQYSSFIMNRNPIGYILLVHNVWRVVYFVIWHKLHIVFWLPTRCSVQLEIATCTMLFLLQVRRSAVN